MNPPNGFIEFSPTKKIAFSNWACNKEDNSIAVVHLDDDHCPIVGWEVLDLDVLAAEHVEGFKFGKIKEGVESYRLLLHVFHECDKLFKTRLFELWTSSLNKAKGG
jgi:hypothetical protein